MKKRTAFVVVLLMALPVLWIASGRADVVKLYGVPSFVEATENPRSGASVSEGIVKFSGPEGQVFFLWASGTAFKVPAEPFLEAGLDPAKLPGNILYDDSAHTLLIGDAPKQGGESTAEAIFSAFLKTHRLAFGYHGAMDHFGVDVGGSDGVFGGGKFEWAKDPRTNDKDIVFIIDPRPLERAGLRSGEVKGWLLLDLDVTMNSKAPRLASLYEIDN